MSDARELAERVQRLAGQLARQDDVSPELAAECEELLHASSRVAAEGSLTGDVGLLRK